MRSGRGSAGRICQRRTSSLRTTVISNWVEGGAEAATHTLDGWEAHEDDEDDDPSEANGDERDTNNAEDEVRAGWMAIKAYGHSGPGCSISDPDIGIESQPRVM